MAKNFGVKYTNGTNDIFSVSGYFKTRPNKGQKRLFKSLPQIGEIHPDSLSIFEPQNDDILHDIISDVAGVAFFKEARDPKTDTIGLAVPQRINGKEFYYSNPTNCIILQRNGKPFITPQEEA